MWRMLCCDASSVDKGAEGDASVRIDGQMDRPSLLYFQMAGRALPSRLCLFAAFGADGWDNVGMSFEEFGAEKAKFAADPNSSKLHSGSVPQLTLGSKTFGQSKAIMSYALAAAKRMGVSGYRKLYVDDPLDVLVAEEAWEYATEIMDKSPQHPDKDVKKAKREEYAEGPMKRMCGILEQRMGEREGSFLFGAQPCYADLAVMALMGYVKSGQFDYVPPTYVDQFPRLSAHHDAALASELVVAYKKEMGEKAYI